MRRLLSYDGNLATYHNYDPDTDTTRIETWQDSEPFIELAKHLRNNPDVVAKVNKMKGVEAWWVGLIPNWVEIEWRKRYGITNIASRDFEPQIRRLLNSPEWSWMKVTDKKI